MNNGNFGHVTTFWIFMHIKTKLISNIESNSTIKFIVELLSMFDISLVIEFSLV